MAGRGLRSRTWTLMLAFGILVLAGCSEPGGSIELQVISGLANQPEEGWTLGIDTPNGEASGPLGIGDQTNSENWATFDVDLDEGDEVTIVVRNAGGTVVLTETCVVDDAATLEYARIFVYLHTQPRTVSCDEGFVHTF